MTAKILLGLSLLFMVQILVGSALIFLFRRRNAVQPRWTFLKTVRIYFLLGIAVGTVGLIPLIGPYAAVVVSLIGVKRLSGLDVLSTFILCFCLGVLLFALTAILSNVLEVDLLYLREP